MFNLLFNRTPEEYEYHHRCFGTAATLFYAITLITKNHEHVMVLTYASGFFIGIAWLLKLGVLVQGGYCEASYNEHYNKENNDFD